MSVYVVGPTTGGLPEVAVITQLRALGVTVVDALSESDELLLVPGWLSSAAARREVKAARERGLRVTELVAFCGQVDHLTWAEETSRKHGETVAGSKGEGVASRHSPGPFGPSPQIVGTAMRADPP